MFAFGFGIVARATGDAVDLLELSSGTIRKRFLQHSSRLLDLRVSKFGLVTAHDDGSVFLRHFDGNKIVVLSPRYFAFSSSPRLLSACSHAECSVVDRSPGASNPFRSPLLLHDAKVGVMILGKRKSQFHVRPQACQLATAHLLLLVQTMQSCCSAQDESKRELRESKRLSLFSDTGALVVCDLRTGRQFATLHTAANDPFEPRHFSFQCDQTKVTLTCWFMHRTSCLIRSVRVPVQVMALVWDTRAKQASAPTLVCWPWATCATTAPIPLVQCEFFASHGAQLAAWVNEKESFSYHGQWSGAEPQGFRYFNLGSSRAM